MSSEAVFPGKTIFFGRTKNPLTFSDVRRLTNGVRMAVVDAIWALTPAEYSDYRLPAIEVTSTLMISFVFTLGGSHSLTILPQDDHSVSISMEARGCAPEVMQAIRPVLLSVGIDWLALSYRADDAGDAFEMVVGSINDLGDGDDE